MIEDLIESPLFRKYAPPVAGAIFIVVFSSLAMWQLDRAAEKKALLELFDSETPFSRVNDYAALAEYERIQVDGSFLSERQILIDNIVENGRPGYFVITPFRPSTRQPLLLVNRGWIAKTGFDGTLPEIDVDDNRRTIRGLAWHLPRVGIRPGEAFAGSSEWPRVAVYPTLDEVATQLEETVLPRVLLLAPTDADGFVRAWQPNVSGPMTHYGYAFQWLAMAAAVVAILYWNLRKRRQRD